MNKIKKRRLKNKISKNKTKIIVIICVIFVLLLSVGYGVSSTLISLNGTATIGEENNCKYKISLEYSLINSWNDNDGHKNYFVNIRFKNDGPESIPNWIIKIKGPNDIKIQTNANITYDNGVATLTPYSWNSIIESGKELNLDSIVITVEENFDPEYIIFNDCKLYGKDAVNPDPVDPSIELTNLELSPSSYEMIVGEKVTLNTIKTPSNASATLTYTSSNESVATVSQSGEVTALTEGTTTITVSSGSISTSSTITVKKKDETPVTPDGIELKFAQTGYWGDISTGQTMNFNVTITNNTDNKINSCSFFIGFPSGSKYTIWTGNVTVNDGDFSYNSSIDANGNVIIYGQVTLPAGYDVNDYFSPSITNIQVS